MSNYGLFQGIYMSFYSRDLYRDVGQNWGGKAFLYLFVVLALSWIAQTFMIQSSLNRLYATESDFFVAQIPVVTVTQGKLSTPEKKPYIINEPGSKKIFAIIDTTGTYKDLSKAGTDLLVTDTEIISKPNDQEVRIYQIPSSFSATINPLTINDHIKSGLHFAWIFIYIFLLLFSFCYRIFQALVYAIIGKIFCVFSSCKVSYGTIVEITLIAITPALVLSTILDLLMYSFPYQHLTYFIITMLYMFYGIRANQTNV